MIRVIAAKELRALFASPLAWLVLGLLQFVLAWIFLLRLDAFIELQPRLAQLANAPGATDMVVPVLCSAAAMLLLTITPLFAMRLIAEERRNGTMTLLVSSPVSMTAIAVGKYLALLCLLGLVVAQVGALSLTLYAGGRPDLGLIATNLLGLLLMCTVFAAVALYASSLTAQPIVAALTALAMLLASWLVGMAASAPSSPLQLLAVTRRFESFNTGLLDTADLAWFPIVAVLFVALAVRRLDRDRLLG